MENERSMSLRMLGDAPEHGTSFELVISDELLWRMIAAEATVRGIDPTAEIDVDEAYRLTVEALIRAIHEGTEKFTGRVTGVVIEEAA